MILTITSTAPQADDLSYLLHKHPGRLQSFELNFGKAHVFYPEVSDTRCTATLFLEIDLIRGQKVIVDIDLANLYGVETRVLKQAVRRNREKFPTDFMFQLTREETQKIQRLRSQFVILKRGQHLKYLPHVFTEHGAIMAANVLNSPRAVQMSVFVVRAFVKMRSALSDTRELARKLADLEKELKDRLDVHDAAIVTILQRIMDIIDPPLQPEPPQKRIGFRVREAKGRQPESSTGKSCNRWALSITLTRRLSWELKKVKGLT